MKSQKLQKKHGCISLTWGHGVVCGVWEPVCAVCEPATRVMVMLVLPADKKKDLRGRERVAKQGSLICRNNTYGQSSPGGEPCMPAMAIFY